MLKDERLEMLSKILHLTGQPFQGLEQPVLAIYLDTGPRWSNPASVLADFQVQTAHLIAEVTSHHPEWRELLMAEVARTQSVLESFLRSEERDAGVMLFSAEWGGLLEAFPLSVAPKTQCFYDYYLHLELWLSLTGQKQAEVSRWFQSEAVSDRLRDPDFVERLGYGAMELQRGQWFSNEDVVAFVHPYQGPRSYVRSLLQLLGKRFPDTLAPSIWEAITGYAETRKAQGKPSLPIKELAQEWYQLYGVQFVKDWYFGPACPERQYLAGGHEWQPGPIVEYISRKFPILELFGRAGFTWGQVFHLFWLEPGFSFRGLKGQEDTFWPWLVASLDNFLLSEEQVHQATQEIQEHARQLNLFEGRKRRGLALCEAAIDYFRRLEVAGLGPEAIKS